MQGVVPTCLLVGVIAACHTSDPNSPDASTITGDGSNESHVGLALKWSSEPANIPGEVDSNIAVTSMLFRVANLRVIGDAGPGDTRTSVDQLQLSWGQSGAPADIRFGDAPSGLYSHVVMLVEGNITDYSYEITGTARVNGDPKPFKVHDLSPLGISMDTDAMLDPGQETSLGITVRIDEALQSVNFADLDMQNGTLVLDTFDDQMSDFRSKLMDSVFRTDHPVENSGPH